VPWVTQRADQPVGVTATVSRRPQAVQNRGGSSGRPHPAQASVGRPQPSQ